MMLKIYKLKVLALATFLFCLDFESKNFISQSYEYGKRIEFIPHILNLTWVENTGMAFSLLSSSPVLLNIFVSLICILLTKRLYDSKSKLESSSLGIILAGALANLTERLLTGSVTDFLDLAFMDFAIFNLADIYINIGVFLWIIFNHKFSDV